MKREGISNPALSIVIFIAVVFALYYSFISIGIDEGKAVIEALVISSAIITPIVLRLFGRTWKREIGN